MLDERTGILLEKINETCSDGGSKIVEEGELLSCFPETAKIGREELSRILGYLEERRYIDVKYADEGVYCLCPLPEGRLYSEQARQRRLETRSRRREIFLFSLSGAFFGALMGAFIVLLPFLMGGR